MKRSEALADLSRDHHQALFLAMKLRRAEEADAAELRTAFMEFWETAGQVHFRLEEDVLLPAFAGYGDSHDPLVLEVLGDHVAIRQRAAALADNAKAPVTLLHDLGERLANHVRLEERQLFPLIEEKMPADELAALAKFLSEAEAEAVR